MPLQSGIFYTDQGKGFPVLLIHGFCETHEIWSSFSKELAKNFRVVSIDLPGFGNSELLSSPFSLTDVGAKVLEFLKDLKMNSCISVGHSLGGYVTLAMVEKQPELFKAFGLFNSTAYPDTEDKKISRNKVIEFVTRHGVKSFIESFIPPLFYNQSNQHIQTLVKLASQTKEETLVAYVKAMRDRPNRTHVLEQFKGSVLFIAGEKDAGISPDSVKKQVELAFKPTLHFLPQVAHMGMFESEEESLTLTSEFLSKEVKN